MDNLNNHLKENKFKYLFILTLISFALFIIYSYYYKITYENTLSSYQWRISEYEFDIRMIDELLFETDLSKNQIDSVLIAFDQSDGDFFNITKDTCYLQNTYLLFKKNDLIGIKNK